MRFRSAAIVAFCLLLAAPAGLAQSTRNIPREERDLLSGVVLFGTESRVPGPGSAALGPVGPDVQANQDGTMAPQNETSVCANPLDPLNVIGGWNDYRGGDAKAGCAVSFDGGLTWTDAGVMNEPTFGAQGDPALAFDLDGNAYYAFISFNRGDDRNGLFVARSSDGGSTWPQVSGVVVHTSSGEPFEDKEYIDCDTSGGVHDGNVYVSWTRFGGAFIHFSRSVDQGMTWSTPLAISDLGGNQGSVPRVGPNGDVYVAWYRSGTIRLDRSTNGGVTFGADSTIATVTSPISSISSFRANSFPSMDVDKSGGPRSGFVYVVWADRRNGDADVFFIRSTDGGSTFSAPVRVNDDPIGNGHDQFFPWIAVDRASGEIAIVYYDGRPFLASYLIDVYVARSDDGGLSWDATRRVNSVSFDPVNDGFEGAFMGDYNGIAYEGSRAHPLWTDTRTGPSADIFTATVDTRPPSIATVSPGGGPSSGGNVVTITGERLYDGFTASFDGVPGTSATHVSDTEVTVVAPARSGGGPVDVTVDNGFGEDTAAGAYVYVDVAVTGTTSIGSTITFRVEGAPVADYVTLLDAKFGSGMLHGLTWGLKLGPVHRTIHDSIGRGDGPTSAAGVGSDSFMIPNKVRFVGVTAKTQAACDVNGASPGGLVLSGVTTFLVLP